MKRFYPFGIALLVASGWANAAITADFTSTITDVGVVAVAIVGVLVVIKGAQFVFSLLKRA